METSQFNLALGSKRLLINKINPNFWFGVPRSITDYSPNYGLKLTTKSFFYTSNILNQNSSFTFFMSFLHDKTKTCEISFLNITNLHHNQIKLYPHFRITGNKIILDYQTVEIQKTFTSDFQNKQLFILICYDGSRGLYNMSLCHYSSRIVKTISPPINFQSRRMGIDYDGYVNKIGFTENFTHVNSEVYNKIMLEEKRNGSYLK